MLFRAIIIDPITKGHYRTGFKLDPWEEELGQRNDVIPFLGAIEPGIWINHTWPSFAYNEPTLTEVGKLHEYTLFRCAIDQEREKRWKSGDHFQVNSYTEQLFVVMSTSLT